MVDLFSSLPQMYVLNNNKSTQTHIHRIWNDNKSTYTLIQRILNDNKHDYTCIQQMLDTLIYIGYMRFSNNTTLIDIHTSVSQ